VVPAEDPFAAIPGWDGEIFACAVWFGQQTGAERKNRRLLRQGKTAEQAQKNYSAELKTDKSTLLETVREIDEHLKEGAPLPTKTAFVLEAFDRYLIVHACFGEVVNRTLGEFSILCCLSVKLSQVGG